MPQQLALVLEDAPPVEYITSTPVTPYEKLRTLEAAIPHVMEEVSVDDMTYHNWCKGLYARRMHLPAGTVLVGKMHKEENLFFLLAGSMMIYSDTGDTIRIDAPFMSTSAPGTKRAGLALTDCIVMNIHPNPDDETDLGQLEERYVLPELKPALPPSVVRLLLEKHS